MNGPNLNLLGARRPEIYGTTTLGELDALCRQWGEELGCVITTFQSNHEGALVDRLHNAIGACDGVIINPGALAHYSYALHDAIEATALPVIEVHISDITKREPWRANSVIAPACKATVSGMGVEGYRHALELLSPGSKRPGPLSGS